MKKTLVVLGAFVVFGFASLCALEPVDEFKHLILGKQSNGEYLEAYSSFW